MSVMHEAESESELHVFLYNALPQYNTANFYSSEIRDLAHCSRDLTVCLVAQSVMLDEAGTLFRSIQ